LERIKLEKAYTVRPSTAASRSNIGGSKMNSSKVFSGGKFSAQKNQPASKPSN
jgi:hypothetical protein